MFAYGPTSGDGSSGPLLVLIGALSIVVAGVGLYRAGGVRPFEQHWRELLMVVVGLGLVVAGVLG